MTGHEGADAIKDEALRLIGEMRGWYVGRDPGDSDAMQRIHVGLDNYERRVLYQHNCIVCAVRARDYGEASKRHRDLEAEANMVKQIYYGVIDRMREIGVAK